MIKVDRLSIKHHLRRYSYISSLVYALVHVASQASLRLAASAFLPAYFTLILGFTKKLVLVLALTGFVFSSSVFESQPANAAQALKTYVVYDSPMRFGEPYPVVDAFVEYLGHFDLDKTVLPLEEWQEGALRDAQIVIFIGLKDDKLSPEFLREVADVPTIVWFERNIEQLASQLGWQDFKYEGIQNGWTSVSAAKENYIRDWMEFVVSDPGADVKIFARLKNFSSSAPFNWQRGNVYYASRLEFMEYPFNVLSVDFLYALIPESYTKTYSHPKNVLLRIEDVSPLVRADAVQNVINQIKKYGIPFAIGVIPVGVNRGQNIYLHERPELVKVLKDAQDSGASIIMHGYTHQNEFSPTTGEGYEFWNAADDKPMDNDEKFTRDKIEASFIELARNGLYPVAFEPPHYAMSKKGYDVLSEYFNVFSGEIQISDRSATSSLSLPYVSESTYLSGMIIIPENMGYYDGHEFTVAGILQNAKNIKEVRDYFGCFFYHGYLTDDKIGVIIEGIQKQGYIFFDLRSLPVKAGSDKVKIILDDNKHLSAQIAPELIEQWQTQKEQEFYSIDNIGFVHIIVLILIIAAFIYIIIRLRSNANKKYEV